MNCDSIAPYYRHIETLGMGGALMRRRLCFLKEVSNARRVLILGDGDGRFSREFIRRNPVAQIDSIEVSSGMLKLARKAAGEQRITYLHADARDVALPDQAYDLIVTHFFFDCFPPKNSDRLSNDFNTRLARARCGWFPNSESRNKECSVYRQAS